MYQTDSRSDTLHQHYTDLATVFYAGPHLIGCMFSHILLISECSNEGSQPITQATESQIMGETNGPTDHTNPEPLSFGPSEEPGEIGTLGRYRILQKLGQGGMGAIYLAFDARLDRQLAIKVMLPKYVRDPVAKERFLREAQAAARIDHDNVVTIYEADECDGISFIAMPLLRGCALDAYLKQQPSIAWPEIVRMARDAASGLAAAHDLGLVHRDIKPSNLWLEETHARVQLLDFGLAKPISTESDESTDQGILVGTPNYMSPEQAESHVVDARSDLFSLGIVLYRLCTGVLPFDGPTPVATLLAVVHQEPTPISERNPSIPPPLAALIHQLLAKNPNDRPQSAVEIVKRLAEIAELSHDTEPVPHIVIRSPEPETEEFPLHVPTGGLRRWFGMGLFGLVLMVVSGAVVKDSDKSLPRIEPALPIETLPLPRPMAVDIEPGIRSVLSVGGKVWVQPKHAHELVEVGSESALPAGPYVNVRLDLRNNTTVTDADLTAFDGCRSVKYLNLVGTAITDHGLAYFKNCEQLQLLELSGTKVSDAGLAHFQSCPDLNHLGLDNTAVTDKGLSLFRECKKLQKLILSQTQVTQHGLKHFAGCAELRCLQLSGPSINDAGLAHFQNCDQLTCLHLSRTALTDAGLAHFKRCKNLTILFLNGNVAVTDRGLAHFAGNDQLWLLYLGSTQVTDAGLAHFQHSHGLGWLDLHNTAVSDAGLAVFNNCPNLQQLRLTRTPNLSAEAIATFRKALPECELVR